MYLKDIPYTAWCALVFDTVLAIRSAIRKNI